jgi:hypothetical protein
MEGVRETKIGAEMKRWTM